MPDGDTDERLAAHRAAFFAVVLIMDEAKPGAFENVIEVLATLEEVARQRGEPDAYVAELRLLREGLESQHGEHAGWQSKPPQPPEGEPGPSAPSGPTS